MTLGRARISFKFKKVINPFCLPPWHPKSIHWQFPKCIDQIVWDEELSQEQHCLTIKGNSRLKGFTHVIRRYRMALFELYQSKFDPGF